MTIEGATRPLPSPFFVIATQNPSTQGGTFALPESQLDRFLMRVSLGYPAQAAEKALLLGASRRDLLPRLPPILSHGELAALQQEVKQVRASDPLVDYVLRLVGATRACRPDRPGRRRAGAMAAARGVGALSARLRKVWQAWLARRLPPSARVELTQRLPNRAGAVFAALLLLILLVAINYQNSLAYGLCFLLLSVFVVAILHTYRNLRGLVLSAGVGPAVFVGEEARFVVRLESTGKSHQAIHLGWSAQPTQLADVPPTGVHELQLTRPTQKRGWLVAPRIGVHSSFPLGIVRAWSWVDLGQQVLVYPQPLEGELPILASLAEDEPEVGVRAHGQGVDDYQGLKPYQPGDSWRRLHWKAYSAASVAAVPLGSGTDPARATVCPAVAGSTPGDR